MNDAGSYKDIEIMTKSVNVISTTSDLLKILSYAGIVFLSGFATLFLIMKFFYDLKLMADAFSQDTCQSQV